MANVYALEYNTFFCMKKIFTNKGQAVSPSRLTACRQYSLHIYPSHWFKTLNRWSRSSPGIFQSRITAKVFIAGLLIIVKK